MRQTLRFALALALVTGCGAHPSPEAAGSPSRYQLARSAGPGPLVLGGGGEAPGDHLKRFVAAAGGPEAPLVVVPFAAGAPSGARYEAELKAVGARRVSVLSGRPERREAELAAVRGAFGLYFVGGLPDKLLAAHQPYLEATREAWRSGCVLGGHSAGAMAWGERVIVAGESEVALRHGLDEAAGGLAVREGFAFLPGLILDPHFSERSRFGRLYVATGGTGHVGLGIDSDTTAIFQPDGALEVYGAGAVTVIRPEKGGARVTIVRAGDRLMLVPSRDEAQAAPLP